MLQVQGFVASGQLQFANGCVLTSLNMKVNYHCGCVFNCRGWCMHDEATPVYGDMIDQVRPTAYRCTPLCSVFLNFTDDAGPSLPAKYLWHSWPPSRHVAGAIIIIASKRAGGIATGVPRAGGSVRPLRRPRRAADGSGGLRGVVLWPH